MQTEMKGTVLASAAGKTPFRYKVKTAFGQRVMDVYCECGIRPARGETLHFFGEPSGPSSVKAGELVPEPAKGGTAREKALYVASGGLPFLTMEQGAAIAENILKGSHRRTLGREEAAKAGRFTVIREEFDAFCLSVKRRCPELSRKDLYACFEPYGSVVSAEAAMKEDPYAFFGKALAFAEADRAVSGLGIMAGAGGRIKAFLEDLQKNGGRVLCRPEKELEAFVRGSLGLSGDTVRWYLDDRVEDGSMVRDYRGTEAFIYTKASYRAETFLAESVARFSGNRSKGPGAKAFLKKEGTRGPDAEAVWAASSSPLAAIIREGPAEGTAGLLSRFFAEGGRVECVPIGEESVPGRPPGEGKPTAYIVTDAGEKGFAFYMGLFELAGKKDRVILIGSGKAPEDADRGAFHSIASSGICPVAGGGGLEGFVSGYSLLADRLRKNAG